MSSHDVVCCQPIHVQLQRVVVTRGLANPNADAVVVSDLDVANHANVNVGFAANDSSDAIFDVIDHDGHGSCLLTLSCRY